MYNIILHVRYRTSFLNLTQADIVAKKNETTWTPETGYSLNATPFDVPWRVTGDTVDNAVRLIFDLTNENLGDHCPKRESGLTVYRWLLFSLFDLVSIFTIIIFFLHNKFINTIITTYELYRCAQDFVSGTVHIIK